MKNVINVILACCLVGFAMAEFPEGANVFLHTGNSDSYIDTYVTNLSTHIEIQNGTLSFIDNGTNLWTSTESHDWGSYLPSGAPNPSADAIAINKPLVFQPVGTEWSVVGVFSVLSLSPGVSMDVMSNEGSVKWDFPDGSSWQWVAESSVDIPAIASSIKLATVDGVEVVQIDYAASDSAAELAVFRSDTMAGTYSSVTNATWTQVDATTRRATIPTGGAISAFFRARIADNIPAHIQSSCPVFFPGGVMTGSSDINPIVYDSAITIEVGGKKYRVAAEALE